jgi:hypothetical protein
MANTLITATGLTREALRVLHNNIVFLKGVNKQYSKEFAQAGAKIGSTLNVRMPNRYFVSHTPTLIAQNTTEDYTPLQLTTQFQVGLNFTQQDLTLSMDDFSKRIIQPAMSALASDMDMYALSMALDVYNAVGTPGSTPGGAVSQTGLRNITTPTIFLNAGAVLDNNACPRDDKRRILLNPTAMAGSVGGLSGLLNDKDAIGEQYRKGLIGKALGFEFAMDQNINTLITGTRAFTYTNWQMEGASQTGSHIHFTVETQAQTGLTFKKGEVFTIAGLYAVNPENQQSTGQLAQFTLTADVAGLGAGVDTTAYISPPIVYAGAGVANGTVTGTQADNAVITMISDASASACTASGNYPQNLAYHEDAFTFATADLEMPRGVDFAAREVFDGISMLVVRAYDINNSQFPCRIDVLAGWKTLRPELACRMWG